MTQKMTQSIFAKFFYNCLISSYKVISLFCVKQIENEKNQGRRYGDGVDNICGLGEVEPWRNGDGNNSFILVGKIKN